MNFLALLFYKKSRTKQYTQFVPEMNKQEHIPIKKINIGYQDFKLQGLLLKLSQPTLP